MLGLFEEPCRVPGVSWADTVAKPAAGLSCPRGEAGRGAPRKGRRPRSLRPPGAGGGVPGTKPSARREMQLKRLGLGRPTRWWPVAGAASTRIWLPGRRPGLLMRAARTLLSRPGTSSLGDALANGVSAMVRARGRPAFGTLRDSFLPPPRPAPRCRQGELSGASGRAPRDSALACRARRHDLRGFTLVSHREAAGPVPPQPGARRAVSDVRGALALTLRLTGELPVLELCFPGVTMGCSGVSKERHTRACCLAGSLASRFCFN